MPGIDICAVLGEGVWARADLEGALRTMQRARLDRMALASGRALAGDVISGNAELKAALDGQPALAGWVTVNPVDAEISAQELRRYAGSSNFLGVRLDARVSRSQLRSDAVREIVNGYRRYSKPVLVTVRDEREVMELEQLAREVTTLKFIAGGAGGDAWMACGAMAKRAVNVLLEPFTGGCHRGKIEALAAAIGSHRILFATGYPDQNPGAALGLLADAALSDGEKQAILSGNARRLFGFE
jgi:predicted TIM-barrel fold metal-dependent hydrolase